MSEESVQEYDAADFRLRHLGTEDEIDRSQMSVERSLWLNYCLYEAASPYRWLIQSDDAVMRLLFG